MLAVALDQAEIQLEMRDHLHDLHGVVHMQRRAAFGVALHEAAEQQGGQVIADGQGGAHLQRAEAGVAVEQAFDFLRAGEQRHRLRQQRAAQGIEFQALAQPIEQLAVELALQFGQRGAGRRLGQGQ